MMDEIKGELSPEQRAPLRRESKNANILAGAGSGKTRTMVWMILNDIYNGIPPSEIVAFTFTEKAADELLARIHKLGSEYLGDIDLSGIYIGTIHKWCLEYLQERSDFYNFEPFDDLQTQSLVGRIHDNLELENIYSASYPHTVDNFLDDLNVFYSENLDFENVPVKIREPLKKFLQVLKENRLLTFGGMIRNTMIKLEQNGAEPIKSLYVDEYQDVNPAQVELIKKMVSPGNSRIVVGDDMQCIYQWRGSDPQKILEFKEEFSDVESFSLNTNYRSLPDIVEFANKISMQLPSRYSQREMKPWREFLFSTEKNEYCQILNEGSIPDRFRNRFQKENHNLSENLSFSTEEPNRKWVIKDKECRYIINKKCDNINVRCKDKLNTEKVQWVTTEDEDTQTKRVADIVEKLKRNGVEYNQIAILMRSVMNSGRPFVKKLGQRNIPVNCPILSKEGQLITDLIMPIFDWLRKDKREPRNRRERQERIEEVNELEDAVKKWIDKKGAVDRFWDAISQWKRKIENQDNIAYNVRTCLYDLLDYCGLEINLDNQGLVKGLGIASQIIRSVEEVHRRRLSGEPRATPKNIMNETYYELKRNKDDYGEILTLDEESKGVVISTVHQSKGLEWPVVIIPNLHKNKFPVRKRGHGTSFPDEIADRYGTRIEDELRLFYVATTRARDRLFLMDAKKLDREKKSIFLRNLKQDEIIEDKNFSDLSEDVFQLKNKYLDYGDKSPVLIGLSDLLIYLESPYQYLLRRRANIQPSIGEELGYGDSMHEIVQVRYESNEESWDNNKIKEKVKERVHLPYMSKQREEKSEKSIIKRIKKFEELDIFDGDVEVEKSVDLVLENGIVQGVVDFIEYIDEDIVLIRDWKTSIHEDFIPRYKKQMLFYALALERRGYEIECAEIIDISETFESEEVKGIEVEINDEILNDFKTEIELALDDISENKFILELGGSEEKNNWRRYLKQEAGRESNLFD